MSLPSGRNHKARFTPLSQAEVKELEGLWKAGKLTFKQFMARLTPEQQIELIEEEEAKVDPEVARRAAAVAKALTDILGADCPPRQLELFNALDPESSISEEDLLAVLYGSKVLKSSPAKLTRYRNRLRQLQTALNQRFLKRKIAYVIKRQEGEVFLVRPPGARSVTPKRTSRAKTILDALSPQQREQLRRAEEDYRLHQPDATERIEQFLEDQQFLKDFRKKRGLSDE
jgi:hypothetical protein